MINVFYSLDPMMARHVADKAIKKTFPKKDEFNYASFNMAETLLCDVAEECSFIPLGAERKCVLATDCAFLAKTKTKFKFDKDDKPEKLLEYLHSPNENIDLYLLVYSDAVDEKNDFIKAIQQTGSIKGIPVPSVEEWVAYAHKRLAKDNIEIDDDAAIELVRRVDNDYGRFMGELEKVANYSGGERLTKASVEAIVSPLLEDNVFALSDALVNGKTAKAISIYNDLKSHSSDEMRLLNLLAGQFAFIDEVQYLDFKGANEFDIARELKTSAGRVKVTLRSLSRVKPGALAKAMEELYIAQKAILTGQATPEFAFYRFLANCQIR